MTQQNDKKTDSVFTIGEWTFNPAEKQLTDSTGTKHLLEDKVSDLLVLLCRRRGQVVSRDEILTSVWQGRNLSEQTVPVAVSKIRKAIGEASTESVWLQTIPKRGYKLVAEPQPQKSNVESSIPKNQWHPRLTLLGSITTALILLAFFWPKATPLIPPADADKPGIILTVKDIRTSLESQKDTGKIIALSELASFYLSQIPDVLVIRHWWNVDAPDPTGGIYTRYGTDTPVYLLTGSLIEDAGDLLVTLFLSNPKTDEVIWSAIHPVAEGSTAYFNTLGDMFATIGIIGTPKGRRSLVAAPTDDDRYWMARYMAQLSSERSASNAAQLLQEMLTDKPDSIAAQQTATALAARWQSIKTPSFSSSDSIKNRADHLALIDQASIVFFQKNDDDGAQQLISEALTIAPGDHYALSLKAEIHIAKNEMDEAIATYRKAIRLAPFARAYEKRLATIMPETP